MMKYIGKWLKEKPIRCTIISSCIIYLLMEIICRHSLISALKYLVTRPHLFAFNALVIAATVSLAMFFKKRLFAMVVILAFWLVLGSVNGIMLSFRTTPFSFNDLKVLSSVFTIIEVYMEIWQIIVVGILAVLLIAALVVLFRKSPKWNRVIWKGVASVAVGAAGIAYLSYLYVANGILPQNIYNLADAYRDYGFVNCFSQSIFVRGVDKPDEYSVRTVRDIADMLDIDRDNNAVHTPNIIFLQLESFYDPQLLNDVEYRADPIPFFRELKENYTTGFLTVPSFGAGTANTEFEILTGMCLDYFGPGEYPFSTILRRTTAESIAYNLDELDYTSHMIHNNSGNFYGRNIVYQNLGFDTFNSLEYMHDVKINELGWAKDDVLTDQILLCLDSTEAQDFVYTISVQGHGKYPEEEMDQYMAIEIQESGAAEEDESENEEKQELINAYTYYLNQIHEMDMFLKDLVSELEKRDEKTVLVVYGDHLPDFPFNASDMVNGSLYQTEYVVWSNYSLEREVKDLEAYQLSAYVLGRLGVHNGIITKLHQLGTANENYMEDLLLLEYDMLYGEQTIYSAISPYEPSDMQMGIREIQIEKAEYNAETEMLIVVGENFTEWSKVYVNNKEQKTQYISRDRLLVENISIEEEDVIVVGQQTEDKEVLSSTHAYYILNEEKEKEAME